MKILNKFYFIIFFLFVGIDSTNANFKEIKKKAIVKNLEIIFPVQSNKKNCIKELYISPDAHYVKPVLKVKAPSGYGAPVIISISS